MEEQIRKRQAELVPSGLECHICLAPPTNPVATSCGHLFCWPCLYRWLQGEPKPCPVCRAMVRKDINVTPIYGSHDEGSGDPDAAASNGVHIPPRPNPPSRSIPPSPSIPTSPSIPITMDATADEIISGSFLAVATLMEINGLSERARRDLSAALQAERAQVTVLRRERRHLATVMHYLRRRNFALIHEAGERARRQADERRAFLNSVRAFFNAQLEDQLGASQTHHHHHHLQ